MQHEIELKLSINATDVPTLIDWLNTQQNMSTIQTYQLSNIYLDTPDLILSRQKAALRLRNKNGKWLQTFKTLGHSEKGLSARLEWETLATDNQGTPSLALEAFAKDTLGNQAVDIISPLINDLTAIFEINFQRQCWIYTPKTNAEIEISIDQGNINIPGTSKTMPLCEVELEAKTAEATMYLLEYANHLGQVVDLTPDDVSKAQRGYALFNAVE